MYKINLFWDCVFFNFLTSLFEFNGKTSSFDIGVHSSGRIEGRDTHSTGSHFFDEIPLKNIKTLKWIINYLGKKLHGNLSINVLPLQNRMLTCVTGHHSAHLTFGDEHSTTVRRNG